MSWKMMRKSISRSLVFAPLLFLWTATSSDAFHLFRGDDDPNNPGGCSPAGGATQPVCCPATGNLGDTVNEADIGATVLVLHNSYNDAGTLLPLIAHIKAGQAVQWKWASSHCHSVTAEDGSFESGFFYPTTRPAQMEAVHGFLDYPLPDPNPSLTYTHTFAAAGQYLYHCVHHQVIGMEGIVIVDP